MNIYTDRNGDFNEENVGGILCIDDEKLITTIPSSIEVRSDTTNEIDELTTLFVDEKPMKSEGRAPNPKGSEKLEFLLSALCVILTAFLTVYIILNRDRLLAQIGCSKSKQNNFRSTTTLNTAAEATVQYSTCSLNEKNIDIMCTTKSIIWRERLS